MKRTVTTKLTLLASAMALALGAVACDDLDNLNDDPVQDDLFEDELLEDEQL